MNEMLRSRDKKIKKYILYIYNNRYTFMLFYKIKYVIIIFFNIFSQ